MPDFQIVNLTLEQVRKVYPEQMVPAFPVDELKPLKMIEQALARGEYLCLGAANGDEVLAIAFFVRIVREGRTLMLFDYFAVREDLRDRGLGGRFLRGLIAEPFIADADAVLLEVDEPDAADTPQELDTRSRRLAFYLRNGLRDTGEHAHVYGVTYRLLTLPTGGALTPDEVRGTYAALYHSFLPDHLYRRWVFIEGYPEPRG